MREEVHVRRVPINRVVDGPIPVRHVGDTMIISLLEEVLVVEKRLMLKEELHITKGEVETYKPQRVILRSEEATIERVDAADSRGDGNAAP
jgi:stress response protein YsnF